MSMQNLAIVFGPTLFGQGASINGQGGVMADQSYQNTVRIFPLSIQSGFPGTDIGISCGFLPRLTGN